MFIGAELEKKRFWVHCQYLLAKLDGDEIGMCVWEENLRYLDLYAENSEDRVNYGRKSRRNKIINVSYKY